MKRLKPLPLKANYFKPIEDEVNRLFLKLIYQPLIDYVRKEIGVSVKLNSGDALLEAISEGRIYYADGVFRGDINAKISRRLRELGARYSKKLNGFVIEKGNIPPELRIAQAGADMRYNQLRQGIIKTLDDMRIDSIDEWSNASVKYSQSVEWMNDDFQKAVHAITIPPKLTDAQRQIISDEWGKNLDLYIKKWANENILKLRQQVTSNAFAGRRAEDMESMIQANYHVSRRKAKFLARQETSLLMSKFHETRYKDIGVTQYIWEGADDERERPDHKLLNGKTFNWDSPPIVDRKYGRRAHPGQDYGCRCVAIAIL